MKQFAILLTLLCCYGITSSVTADNNGSMPPVIPGRGQSLHLPVCSVVVNPGIITLCFNTSLDNIQIVVEDETGLPVYQTNASTNSGQSILIDANGWSNGTYFITITDSKGNTIQQETIRY